MHIKSMSISHLVGRAFDLMAAMWSVIGAGLLVTMMTYMAYNLLYWISDCTRLEKPDPTFFKRVWQRFYQQQFHPFGAKMVHESRGAFTNYMSYISAVGVVATLAAVGLHFTLSSTLIGTSVAAHYWLGIEWGFSSLIDQIAAFGALLVVAVVFHATQFNPEKIHQ
jgi:uncharacterized membrane protein